MESFVADVPGREIRPGVILYDIYDDLGEPARLICGNGDKGRVGILFIEPRDISEVSGEPNFDFGLVIRQDDGGDLFFSSIFDLWPRKGAGQLRHIMMEDERVEPSHLVSSLVLATGEG